MIDKKIIILSVVVILVIGWFWDSYCYDKDLENDVKTLRSEYAKRVKA